MEREEVLNIISKSIIFAGAEDRIEEVFESGLTRRYAKGEYVFVQGEKPRFMYILLKGSVNLIYDDLFGNREMLGKFRRPGVLFGEIFLYLGNDYQQSCVADEDTSLFLISRNFFSTIKDGSDLNIKIMENFIKLLSQRTYSLNIKSKVLGGASIRQKICRFLYYNAWGKDSYNLPFNREDFASYLSVARPSLSREMMSMEREGFFHLKGREVKKINWDMVRNLI